MEIEARVIAAALDHMNMFSVDSIPSENILPASLEKADGEVQKKFLKELVYQVVDTYVVNEQNINAHIEALESESRIDIGILPNGRFACRYPGCKKNFAFDGKRRIAHEKIHGLHGPVPSTTTCGTIVNDDCRNYQLALLEYGMLFLNFSDAITEGDGLRILRCWKFFLMFLKANGASSRKYALEGMHLISQVYALLSPRDAHRLIWNRFVKAKPGIGGNIPLDLALEHFNRVLKEVIKKMGPNASNPNAVNRFCKSIAVTKQLMDNFDSECRVLKQSGKHVQKKYSSDLNKIVNELVANNAFRSTKGRSYKCFRGCSASLLDRFDLRDMFNWINSHKRTIYLNKSAR
jgi:hypothetical protein